MCEHFGLQENSEAWGKATAIVAAAGSAAEDIRYWKSSSIYLWLLGYEFTGTMWFRSLILAVSTDKSNLASPIK